MQILEGSDNTKVCKQANEYPHFESIFGTEVISKGTYEWKIRVNKFNYTISHYYHFYMGVIDVQKADLENVTESNVTVSDGGYTFDVTLGQVMTTQYEDYAGPRFDTKVTKVGDIVDLTLDLTEKTLSCKINDQPVEKTISSIEEGEYKLIVSMYFGDNELELL